VIGPPEKRTTPRDTGGVSIAPFGEEHIADVARLWNAERPGAGDRWRRRFRWQYVDNPARGGAEDIGLILRTGEGRVVGAKLWMPQRFMVLGEERTVRVSTDTIVDPAFREHSLRLIFEYFRRHADPFALSTSAGERHARIWLARRGACVPRAEMRHTVALRARRFIEAKLAPRTGPTAAALAALPGAALWHLRFGRGWRGLLHGIRAEDISADDPRLAALWERGKGDYAVTAVRDRRFLAWRHGAARSRLVLLCEAGGEPLLWAAYVAAPGTETDLRRARVLDVFGGLSSGVERRKRAVACFLGVLYERGFDAADFYGLAPAWQETLRTLGARRFAAPCNFVYVARGRQAAALAEAGPWHIVPADGDTGFWDLPDFPPHAEGDTFAKEAGNG